MSVPGIRTVTSRYQLVLRIATGGMGTVHLGVRRGAGGGSQFVAVKRAHRHLANDSRVHALFVNEAKCTAAVNHPNVVRFVDFESQGSELSLVMEYVEGATVSKLALRGARLPTSIALRVAIDVCAGLEAIHRAKGASGRALGLVHRDISPQNILLGVDGFARIADFGVAKMGTEGEDGEAGVFGKLGYMAPEVLAGDRASTSSDLYALGVVIWEMLAGERLVDASFEAEPSAHGDAFPSLGRRNVDGGAELDAVLARALAKDPSQRFADAGALRQAIEAVAGAAGAAERGLAIASHDDVAAFVEEAGSRLEAKRTKSTRPSLKPAPLSATMASYVGPTALTRPSSTTSRMGEKPARALRLQRVALAAFALFISWGTFAIVQAVDDPSPPHHAAATLD